MTTTISSNEIKIFFIQIMYVAITTIIIGLYLSSQPTPPETPPNPFIETLTGIINAIPFVGGAIVSVLSTIGSLMSMVFWVPDGLGDQWLVIALIKVPFDLFDLFIGARLIKDIISGWT